MANKKDIPDFTVPSALLYVAQTNPKTEQDYMNMSAAQDIIRKSGLTAKEIRAETRRLLKEDKKDKEIIAEQTKAGLIKGKIKKPDVPKLFEDAFKESGINLEDRKSRNQNLPASNRQVAINLARRKREREEQFGDLKKFRGTGNNKGGVILKANKEKMAYGGMASGKKHMYATGGSVKDNAGLRALKKASPMAYNKIKGIV